MSKNVFSECYDKYLKKKDGTSKNFSKSIINNSETYEKIFKDFDNNLDIIENYQKLQEEEKNIFWINNELKIDYKMLSDSEYKKEIENSLLDQKNKIIMELSNFKDYSNDCIQILKMKNQKKQCKLLSKRYKDIKKQKEDCYQEFMRLKRNIESKRSMKSKRPTKSKRSTKRSKTPSFIRELPLNTNFSPDSVARTIDSQGNEVIDDSREIVDSESISGQSNNNPILFTNIEKKSPSISKK